MKLVRRLRLRGERIKVLAGLELGAVQGGRVAVTDDCPSAYTYCYKYCGD